MKHVTRDELVRFRDNAESGGRDRVVGHLAECGLCTREYAELIRQQPALEPSERFDAAAFLEEGRRALKTPAPLISRGAMWKWMGLAAAAAVLAAVVGPRVLDSLRTQSTGGTVLRGAEIQPLAPSGVVESTFSFRWQYGGDEIAYLVEVFNDRRELVLSRRTLESELTYSAIPGGELEPGVSYSWMVSVLDSRGEPLLNSSLTTFRIQPPPPPPE